MSENEKKEGSAAADGYSLEEARRQIGAIWKVIDDLREKMDDVKEETIKNREVLSSINVTVAHISQALERIMSDPGTGIVRCAERKLRLERLESEQDEMWAVIEAERDSQEKLRSEMKEEMAAVHAQSRVFKWIAGVAGTVSGGFLLYLLTEALKLIH